MLGSVSSYVRKHHLGLVAVFLALTGTTYAATAAKNSVTSKSIKNSSVKSADVGDDSLTGTDVNEATLKGITGPAGERGPTGPEGPQGPAGPATGPAGGDLAGTYPDPEIRDGAVGSAELAPPLDLSESSNTNPIVRATNSGTSSQPGLAGITNSNSSNATGVRGEVASTNAGGFSAGVIGVNNTTVGVSGIGVYGQHSGNGTGVWGNGNFTGVRGISGPGTGVAANSNSGTGLEAQVASTGNPNPAARLVHPAEPGAALELSGGLRIVASGNSGTPAFVHTAASGGGGNVCGGSGQFTEISNPYSNGSSDALLLVSQVSTGGAAETGPVAARYEPGSGCTAGRWAVEALDGAMQSGAAFNVLVINTDVS